MTLPATGFWSALAFRVLFGVMEGIYNIAQFAVAGFIFPGQRALVNGMTQVFYGIGNFGGQTFVGSLLHLHPGFWQLPLWCLGGVTMAYALASMFLFDRKYLYRNTSQTTQAKLGFWPTLKIVVTNIRVWKALTIHACNMIPNWAILGLGNYLFIRIAIMTPRFRPWYSARAPAPAVCSCRSERCGRIASAAPGGVLLRRLDVRRLVPIVLCCAPQLDDDHSRRLRRLRSQRALHAGLYHHARCRRFRVGKRHGVATGMAGGFGHLFAVLSGPLIGSLIPLIGPVWSINIVVIGCEFLVIVFGFLFLKDEKPAVAVAAQ